jgi:hypothetical protein
MLLASMVGLVGACADPCIDDGLLQKRQQRDGEDCPQLHASDTDSAGEGASGTDSASASGTDSASGDASHSGSADGGSQSGTMDDGASMDASGTMDAGDADGTAGTPDHCDNGVQDGDESDVDCGGSCEPCDDGQTCYVSPDCKSLQCTPDMTCGAEDWCVPLIDENSCQGCIKQNCCEDVKDCVESDEKCACWVDCIEQNNDFKPCEDQCEVTGKPGKITSCANSQCNYEGACG